MFAKAENNTQVSENLMPSNDDSTKQTNVNFSSLLNTVLLQTAIATVENANIQCKIWILFGSGAQSLYIIPHLKEKLNSETIASHDETINIF